MSSHHSSWHALICVRILLALALLLVMGLIVLLGPARGWLSQRMYLVTGEEDFGEQLKGTAAYLWLQLRHGEPETHPYIPMPHTGLCPYGINTFLEQEVEPAKVELAMGMIAEAGFCFIRQEFPWEDIEISAKGDFWDHKWDQSAWDKYDRIVDVAERNGLQIIARLDNPPAWSRAGGDEIGPLAPPDDYGDFGDFVYAVVNRYRGRVRYYQIWNEPNIYPEWGEQPVNANQYVELLKIAYTRAKEADPDCVILSAGLAQTTERGLRNMDDTIYLRQMYDAGAQPYFDIMAVMAYGLWTGPTDQRASLDRTNFSRPEIIRELMVQYGDGAKPIWATEIGWNALPDDFGGFPNFGRVTLEQQARYAVEAYQRAQRDWPWMGVMNYWFFKRATDLETDQTFYYFRMVEPDFTPLPAYAAIRDYANQPPTMHKGYHQEDHWALDYDGAWTTVLDPDAVLGGYAVSETAGDSVAFVFHGTALTVVAVTGPQGGTAQIQIDDRPAVLIDCASASPRHAVEIPIAARLDDGPHDVTLTIVGDGAVMIDGWIVKRPEPLSLRWIAALTALGAGLGCVACYVLWRRRRHG